MSTSSGGPTYLRVERRAVPQNPNVLTIEEVANELRISVASVYRLMRARRLSFLELGRRRRVTRAQLDHFLESVTVEGVSA